MSGITTHILDVSRGLPAAAVVVQLEREVEGVWKELSESLTDGDGRARLLAAEEDLLPGSYRINFEVAAYFAASGTVAFYPSVQITFTVRDAKHHHVPLLLSPYGFSTYRGS